MKHTINIDGEEILPIVTSHSIDGTYQFCPRKFEFAHVYQQVPEAGSVGLAAEAGTALHEAVQAWASIWLAPGANQTKELWESAIDAGLYALIQWWPWVTERLSFEDKKLAARQRNLEQSIRLFYVTVQHDFWNEFELAVLPNGQPAIEIPWRVIHKSMGTFTDPVGRKRILVTQGKIDFVLRHKPSGMVRIYDLKTTTKWPETLDASFRFSGQAVGYSVILGGAVGWEWREGFKVTYIVAGYNDFAIRPLTYTISGQEVEDFLTTRDDILHSMATNLRRGWWPRRLHGCDSYASACPYLDICQRRDSNFISAWFERDDTPFQERPRIYETLWDFMA